MLAFTRLWHYLARNAQAEVTFELKGEIIVANEKPIRVAIIGLGFGAEFIPIYQKYPGAEIYAICRRDRKGLDECGERYGIKARYTDYREMLKDPNVDAVHINSPIPDHAWMSVEALKAGKHVACTVPMGTSIDECRQIVEAQRSSGKTYMMMETVVYSREYLFVKELYDEGSSAGSSSCAAATSKTWTAGPITGPACRRCGTPPTASARAWRFWASTPAGSSATVLDASAKS